MMGLNLSLVQTTVHKILYTNEMLSTMILQSGEVLQAQVISDASANLKKG